MPAYPAMGVMSSAKRPVCMSVVLPGCATVLVPTMSAGTKIPSELLVLSYTTILAWAAVATNKNVKDRCLNRKRVLTLMEATISGEFPHVFPDRSKPGFRFFNIRQETRKKTDQREIRTHLIHE